MPYCIRFFSQHSHIHTAFAQLSVVITVFMKPYGSNDNKRATPEIEIVVDRSTDWGNLCRVPSVATYAHLPSRAISPVTY
jgi:hypothetical protein